jgi:hypothetical protein
MGAIRRGGAADKKDAFELRKVLLVVLNQAARTCERAATLTSVISNGVSRYRRYVQVPSRQIGA